MAPPPRPEINSSDFPSDESIMAEVKKIKGWREEGIDTDELERLLFSDLEEYNNLKIKILTDRLERSSNETISPQIGPNTLSPLQKGPAPDIKKDVITNIALQPQKTPIDPYGGEQELGPSKIKVGTGEKSAFRIGRFRIDKGRGKIALFSIAAIVIAFAFAGAGSYFLFLGPDEAPIDISASFKVSDLHPVSGSFFNLTASENGRDLVHTWKIVPGDYELFGSDGSRGNLSVYFTQMGDYTITHSVKSGDKLKEESMTITVSKRTIRIDRERIGDISKYDLSGKIFIENIDELFDFPESTDFRTMEMKFSSKSSDPSSSELALGDPEFKDGYGETYSTILRTIGHNMDISGSITDSGGTIMPFDGEIETDERNHIDLYNKKLARMDVTSRMKLDIQLQAGNTKRVDQIEKSEMFPDQDKVHSDLRLEDITQDRYISEDGFGTVLWGSSKLNWKVENVEWFGGTPCLNVSLSMEPLTLEENDLSEFSMHLLLSDALPVAKRSIVHMRSTPAIPNPYDITTVQRMSVFTKGLEPVIYGTLDSFHVNTTNIFSVYSDLIQEYDEKWTYTPEYGTITSSIPTDFDAGDAIARFSDKPAFKNFIQGLDDPYAIYCNFSSMEGRGELWKFSISDRSNPYGWNESVLKESTVTSGFKARIDPVGIGRSAIGGVMTFSGAETALKRLMNSIDPSFGKALYGVTPGSESKLDPQKSSIMIIAQHEYPSIGILNHGTFGRIDYALVLRTSDNQYEVCLDMHSGQLLYLYSRMKV